MLLRLIILTSLGLFVGMSLSNTMEGRDRPAQVAEPLRAAEPEEGTPFATPLIVADDGSLIAEAVPQPAQSDAVDGVVSAVLAELEVEVISAANEESALPVQYVTATRVNLRAGPGTDNAVIGQVEFADAVSVVALLENGWAEIQIEGAGGTGFVAARFLATDPPQ